MNGANGALRLALLGNPNCGKTALFNRLTGSRQKVANYAGVTVERKEGQHTTPAGKTLRVLDLPGTYSLHPRSPDERVTRDVLTGHAAGERRPDVALCVVNATHLRRHLRLVLAVQRLGLPVVVVLNMIDIAQRRGLRVDAEALSRELGVPVIATVATKGQGLDALRAALDEARRMIADPSFAMVILDELNIVLRYSIPIFINAQARPQVSLQWKAQAAADGKTLLTIHNPGAERAQIARIWLQSQGQEAKALNYGLFGYVLPGKTIQREVNISLTQLKAAQITLMAVINDRESTVTLGD